MHFNSFAIALLFVFISTPLYACKGRYGCLAEAFSEASSTTKNTARHVPDDVSSRTSSGYDYSSNGNNTYADDIARQNRETAQAHVDAQKKIDADNTRIAEQNRIAHQQKIDADNAHALEETRLIRQRDDLRLQEDARIARRNEELRLQEDARIYKQQEDTRKAEEDRIAREHANAEFDRLGNLISRQPKSVQDGVTLREANTGAGETRIKGLKDNRYDGMNKVIYVSEKSKAGRKTVVHYVDDPITGQRVDFKFKKHAVD